jgi:hypothetical protein
MPGAAATDYMQLFGLVTFAYMWARMAKVAQDKIASSGATPYLSTKLVTGRFFMERMLPETHVHLARSRPAARPPWNWRRKRSEIFRHFLSFRL